jgi:hypothetical protein
MQFCNFREDFDIQLPPANVKSAGIPTKKKRLSYTLIYTLLSRNDSWIHGHDERLLECKYINKWLGLY